MCKQILNYFSMRSVISGVCGSGVCMMSCGTSNSNRKKDLDLVLHNASVTASQGDNDLCDPCKSNGEDSQYFDIVSIVE